MAVSGTSEGANEAAGGQELYVLVISCFMKQFMEEFVWAELQ